MQGVETRSDVQEEQAQQGQRPGGAPAPAPGPVPGAGDVPAAGTPPQTSPRPARDVPAEVYPAPPGGQPAPHALSPRVAIRFGPFVWLSVIVALAAFVAGTVAAGDILGAIRSATVAAARQQAALQHQVGAVGAAVRQQTGVLRQGVAAVQAIGRSIAALLTRLQAALAVLEGHRPA